jgi:hypothetical protein
MRNNVIEIYRTGDPSRGYKVYFKDRTGKEVFAFHKDPNAMLNMRQKEQFFMGHYIFSVHDSDIKDLERLINWPAETSKGLNDWSANFPSI